MLAAIPLGFALCLVPAFLHDPETFRGFGLGFFAVCILGCTAASIAILAHRRGERRLAILIGILLSLLAWVAFAVQMTPK